MATVNGRKTGGRKKGTPNKFPSTIKEMIINALDKAGGEEYLLQQALSNPTAFLTLIGKVLPTQITGDPTNPLQAHLTVKYVGNNNPEGV